MKNQASHEEINSRVWIGWYVQAFLKSDLDKKILTSEDGEICILVRLGARVLTSMAWVISCSMTAECLSSGRCVLNSSCGVVLFTRGVGHGITLFPIFTPIFPGRGNRLSPGPKTPRFPERFSERKNQLYFNAWQTKVLHVTKHLESLFFAFKFKLDSIFQHKWCHLLCNTFASQKICKTYFLLWRNSFLSLLKVVLRFRPICHECLHWGGDKWIILVLISLLIPMTLNSTFL